MDKVLTIEEVEIIVNQFKKIVVDRAKADNLQVVTIPVVELVLDNIIESCKGFSHDYQKNITDRG